MKEKIINDLQSILQEKYEFNEEKTLSFLEQAIKEGFCNYQEERMHNRSIFLLALEIYSPKTYKEHKTKLKELYEHKTFDSSMEINAILSIFNDLSKKDQKIFLEVMDTEDKTLIFKKIQNIKEIENREQFTKFVRTLFFHAEKTKTTLEDNLFFLKLAYHADENEKKVLDFFDGYVYLSKQMEVLGKEKYSLSLYEKDFIDSVKDHYNNVVDYTKKLENEKKNSQKKFRKKQEVCKKLIQKLKQIQMDYLLCTEDEIHFLPINILEELEEYYLTHNQTLYERMQKELDLYNGNLEIQMKKVFQEYSYPFFQNEEYKKMLFTFEVMEVKEKLEILKNISDSFSEGQLFSLLCLDKKCLDFIKVYSLTGVFTLPFLLTHINHFNLEQIQRIQNNLNYLKSYGMNLKGLDGILFEEEENLERKMKLFVSYSLPKECFIFSFSPHFFDMVDIWIEKGLDPYLEKNKEVLKKDFETITKRILVSLRFKLPILDEKGLLYPYLYSENKFFISDSELDSYIGNVSLNYVSKEENLLLSANNRDLLEENLDEKYDSNSLTYRIGDILLSRMRVLRNASVMKQITFGSYFYGSVFSLEECEKIALELEKKQVKKN